MARKNLEYYNCMIFDVAKHYNMTSKVPSDNPKYFKSITPPTKYITGGTSPSRWSPDVLTPPPSLSSSPRTSPGLLAGHYAGCKFTEPPLPSALPPPPKHWTNAFMRSTHSFRDEPEKLTHQLKMLLKVQG